jgi:ATP-dependent exoDNAse (exonuclease V) beta subunit
MDDEGINPLMDETWLQERCRMMLRDCVVEAVIDGDFNSKTSLKELNEFVEDFMKRHNLK